jgi:hypothetical protein
MGGGNRLRFLACHGTPSQPEASTVDSEPCLNLNASARRDSGRDATAGQCVSQSITDITVCQWPGGPSESESRVRPGGPGRVETRNYAIL